MDEKKVTKYMTFEMSGRVDRWMVWGVYNNKSGTLLGTITWERGWRQYTFMSSNDCSFNNGCLDEISKFLTELNAEQKS